MEENKKFYWLKLKKDFFKRHDIRIVEDMPNGKDYILFYLKLLVESVDHEGALRFSESIPYNEQMLATITNTNVDLVRAAMQVFTNLNMIEVLDDDTIYMTEVMKMIGYETDWARKKREYRAKKRQIEDNVLPLSDKSKSIELEKEKELETDIFLEKPEKKNFIPPTIEEVCDYCFNRHNNINPQLFFDYYTAKDWHIGQDQMTDWKAAIRAWENNQKEREYWD